MRGIEQFEGQSNFAIYLRTGRRFRHQAGADIEVKFNPWHAEEDGRFTFEGQGNYFAHGQPHENGMYSSGSKRNGHANQNRSTTPRSVEERAQIEDAGIRRRNARLDPHHPSNYAFYKVHAGDTLASIAAKRTGLTVADLAWLNNVRADTPLQIGQRIKLPHQGSLDAGRDAFGVVRGLGNYVARHGHLPSGPGPIVDQLIADRTQITKNGYTFGQDGLLRTRVSQGELSRETSERSKTNQAAAGGADRRRGDDGGHYIARRFNGPSESFNLFAQDLNLNRGAYRDLEKELAGYQRQGKTVYVRIIPHYRGISQRPDRIDYWWRIDSKWEHQPFENERGGKSDD